MLIDGKFRHLALQSDQLVQTFSNAHHFNDWCIETVMKELDVHWSDENFRAFVESAPEANVFVDHRGRIVLVNAQAEKLLGYPRAEMLGQSVLLLIPSRFHSRVPMPGSDGWQRAQQGLQRRGMSIFALRKDGTEFPAEIDIRSLTTGQGTIFATELRDASERRLAEERFRRLIETVADALLIVRENGEITFLNARATDLFGYTRQELQGRLVDKLVPEHCLEQHRAMRTAWFTDPQPRVFNSSSGCSALRKDGSEFPVEIRITPLQTIEEGLVLAATIRDITGQVQAREQLLAHLSELAHESRLSTMGEMVAGLAHELNQPLYAISNYARACQESIKQHAELSEQFSPLADKLVAQTQRAADIVRRLRRFVSRREPRRAAVDINALVREVQQLLLFHAHRFSITTELKLAEKLPPALGDSLLIEQTLVNLVRNAFEAMSEEGSAPAVVTVETGVADNGMIQITVTDTGPGFGQATMDQLFEAFYTTKKQGMGLGLVISRSIAEAHAGQLIAMPNPNGGAILRLTLPAYADAHDH
jgi:two-component system, LuxR family, sensor kinase FixL